MAMGNVGPPRVSQAEQDTRLTLLERRVRRIDLVIDAIFESFEEIRNELEAIRALSLETRWTTTEAPNGKAT